MFDLDDTDTGCGLMRPAPAPVPRGKDDSTDPEVDEPGPTTTAPQCDVD